MRQDEGSKLVKLVQSAMGGYRAGSTQVEKEAIEVAWGREGRMLLHPVMQGRAEQQQTCDGLADRGEAIRTSVVVAHRWPAGVRGGRADGRARARMATDGGCVSRGGWRRLVVPRRVELVMWR